LAGDILINDRLMQRQANTTNHTARLPRKALLSLLIACAFVGGCKPRASSSQRYPLAGRIVSIDQSKQQIIVSHSEVQGYMPAMVMPFHLKDVAQIARFGKSDEITATLIVSGGESWLEDLRITRKGAGADPRDVEINSLPHEGDAVPDFALVNQSGKRISIKQYRGKALLITFIYTRCPLPDYCPLMSSNFAEIDRALQKDPALFAKTHLLSVSFDSSYDTPAVLRSYGGAYTEKFTDERFEHWEFASGSAEEVKAITKFFGLRYEPKSDQIIHSLVTAIISPDGKVFKIYSYDEWKPDDVLADLRKIK
jgi:protein SCO1/2